LVFHGAHLLEISLLLINIRVRNDETDVFYGTPCINLYCYLNVLRCEMVYWSC